MARRRMSNMAMAAFSGITLLCGIVVLGTGIWLSTKHSTDCVRFLEWPIIVLGVAITLISLAGIAGALTMNGALLAFYTIFMLMAILTLMAFVLFAFVVTSGQNGHGLVGKVYKEFEFNDYSDWLRNRVEDRRSWSLITLCLRDAKTCDDMAESYNTLDKFNMADLSAVESGCCKPPFACNYQWRNATNWFHPLTPDANPDCRRWNNDDLCFNCDSCKAGLLQQVKSRWRTVAIIDVVVLAILILAYALALSAFRGAKAR
ncbi:tetraspanin-3 [Selaginella moellendorffii]|uniref:tetraspanin-3 n=1 Tax=Selaginella moellendorffii TaxID=88036 RepID=UPI000D1CB796|nr:tetraspanin-3 [Selaginella moellendorffii]|eukprot:XP_024531449.1 tetraspanin-3 [Selaginella moellendorffii]